MSTGVKPITLLLDYDLFLRLERFIKQQNETTASPDLEDLAALRKTLSPAEFMRVFRPPQRRVSQPKVTKRSVLEAALTLYLAQYTPEASCRDRTPLSSVPKKN